MEKTKAPFLSIPSGIGIGHYFIDETDRRNNGCDGINLYREGRDYCYLWVEAVVDLDMWHAYLLEVRTAVDVPQNEFGETRDYLFVMSGAGDLLEVEWHNQPIRFDAPTDEHWARFRAGMAWFAQRIEKAIEDHETRKANE